KLELRLNRLLSTLSLSWPLSYLLARREQHEGQTAEFADELWMSALGQWVGIRGDRYPLHTREHLTALLAPQSQLLERVLKIGGETWAAGLTRIYENLRRGTHDAFVAIDEVLATRWRTVPDWDLPELRDQQFMNRLIAAAKAAN